MNEEEEGSGRLKLNWKFSQLFSMASGQDAKNCCQKVTECWGASGTIDDAGNGLILSDICLSIFSCSQSFSIERNSRNNGWSPRTCVAHSMRDFPSSPCVIRRMPIISSFNG